MKWLLFIAQFVLAIVGANVSPDYYARTSSTVLAWAYSKGIWVLILSLALSIGLIALARRDRSKATIVLAIISVLLTLVWFIYPMAFSILGDGLFWRFP